MIVTKKIVFEIEYQFGRYHDLKESMEEDILDIIHFTSTDYSSVIIDNGKITDNTSERALKIYKLKFNQDMKWLKVVEETIKRFEGTDLEKLIVKKYFEKKSIAETIKELSIERTCYYLWREQVITYAYIKAIQEGLITI